MKKTLIALILSLTAHPSWPDAVAAPPAPNGVVRPEGYQNWRLIGVSQRTENGTLRAILGNDVAIQAARAGIARSWPDGTILAKIVWKQITHDKFATAMVPGELVHTEFMVKDAARFAATGGWGFARWLGEKLTPYGRDAGFAQECFGCHAAAKDTDWVFTRPVELP